MLLTPEQALIGGTVTIEAPVYYPCRCAGERGWMKIFLV